MGEPDGTLVIYAGFLGASGHDPMVSLGLGSSRALSTFHATLIGDMGAQLKHIGVRCPEALADLAIGAADGPLVQLLREASEPDSGWPAISEQLPVWPPVSAALSDLNSVIDQHARIIVHDPLTYIQLVRLANECGLRSKLLGRKIDFYRQGRECNLPITEHSEICALLMRMMTYAGYLC